MHRVEERLRDLLADVISSMKSQISFLTPVIAGIVIGITSMVTTILIRLSGQMAQMSAESDSSANIGGITSMFGDGIPTYYFQIIVGLYVVQIVYILTVFSNGIENGADKVAERYNLAQNLLRSTIMYAGIAFIVNTL